MAIVSASDWGPVIRRCALHERAAILSALGAVIDRGASKEIRDQKSELSTWQTAAETFFGSQLPTASTLDIRKNHIVLSYLIEMPQANSAPASSFKDVLREVAFEVEKDIRSGWGMFYIFDRPPIWPVWASDAKSGLGEEDFLQVSMLLEKDAFGSDVWRVAPKGFATLIREYWEDVLPGRPPKSIDIYLQVRTIAEFVFHASSLAKRMPEAMNIYFTCRWIGLKDRQVWASGIPFFSARPAAVDTVATSGSWASGNVASDLNDIVAALTERLGRAFGVDITPDYVAATRSRWRRD